MKVGNQSNNVGHDFSVKGVAGSSRRDGAGLDIGGDTGGLVDAVQRPRQRPTMLDVLPRLKFATRIKQQRKMMPSSHRLGRPSDLTEGGSSSGTEAGNGRFKSRLANELASSGKPLKFNKWEPADRFQLSSESDSIVKRGARVQAADRNIPSSNRFSMDLTSAQSTARALAKRPLQRLTLESRLDIHAHGNDSYVEDLTAAELAAKLHDAGLEEVGVLKIQACDVGKGHYLQALLEHLASRGVKVGYLCGPKGALTDTRTVENLGGGEQYVKKDVSFLPGKYVGWLPETFGLNVIKGNVDVAFGGTRYNLSR
ncbi:type III effector protein [Ralstonia pseudosolanacearum]|uniref:Type III effector protein n=1 Tax=Ralstonia nicotianae (strain ATCC BAA-1114 / GMI1000) TaxID=267608 RepID=Q8XUL4_RALN1|nr:hypothetical protein [Ralstonia pseudosolanacearum]AST28657.1 type III effector protein [Ralstonia pseudosolanacearum]MCQ4682453.1 type III effector protein [Ralstonia pseudosolanacearum]MDC6286218.1 type III effector protein [Ralstonia pseudosolanacearum]MDC6295631.1 type III effector protein [Ralstonia pseudosolanacearum]MDD7790546.1 type III effector protein [Ralstonia pseudosolanacearum]